MHNFLFGIYPYITLVVLVVGSIARYETDPFTWKTSSSQLLRRKQLILGSVFFHLGILLIFAGHFVGLLTPIQFFDWQLPVGGGDVELLREGVAFWEVLEAAGVPVPAGLTLDGRSLLPLLEGKPVPWPDRTIVLQIHRHQRQDLLIVETVDPGIYQFGVPHILF